MKVKTVSMRFAIVNSHHPNTFHLSECPQLVGHATTIASGYTYKCSHGVPSNHSSAQTNLASSLIMEHLCQSSQRSTIRNAPKNPLFLQVNQPPLHIMYLLQESAANAEDNVRTAALFPRDATNESIRFAQQGNENEFHSK